MPSSDLVVFFIIAPFSAQMQNKLVAEWLTFAYVD